ncbi:hypothetical protein HDU90_006700 [Geranomyces variabilis]|nr:hypothetical protein HDU90_006700 [Geranomyces variabilis]
MATTTAVDEVVQAKKLQLEHLLEKDAATLALNNANLNVSFKDPMTAEELPAFTWLSILYACTKSRSIDAAKAKQSRFPPAVWEWMQGLVAQLKSDSEARAVFAGLRGVCVRWIGRVGLRRAFSLWDYLCWEGDQYDFEKVALRNMSDADAKRWLLDHYTKTWIAEEPGYKPRYNPYKNFDNGTRELFFVLPIAVTWAIEAARSIQDNGHAEKLRLPKGRFPFPPTADSRSFHRSVQTDPPFRAQCIIIEKQNPLTCRVCKSADNSAKDSRQRDWLRVARVENYVHMDQENPHYFLRYERPVVSLSNNRLEAFFGANLPQPVSGGTKDHLVQQLVAARDSATFLAAKVWERRKETMKTPAKCLGRVWKCYATKATATRSETSVVQVPRVDILFVDGRMWTTSSVAQ